MNLSKSEKTSVGIVLVLLSIPIILLLGEVLIGKNEGPSKHDSDETPIAKSNPSEVFALVKEFYRKGDYQAAAARIDLIDTSSVYWDSAKIINDSIVVLEAIRVKAIEIENAKQSLALVNAFDGKYYYNEIASLLSGIRQIEEYESDGIELTNSSIPEVSAIGKKIKAKATELKNKWKPLYRKEAARVFDKNLWREDIDVKAFGSGYKTLEYVGVYFAANANIEDFNKTMVSFFRDLGFTRIQYRWYEGSEYTYYTLK